MSKTIKDLGFETAEFLAQPENSYADIFKLLHDQCSAETVLLGNMSSTNAPKARNAFHNLKLVIRYLGILVAFCKAETL